MITRHDFIIQLICIVFNHTKLLMCFFSLGTNGLPYIKYLHMQCLSLCAPASSPPLTPPLLSLQPDENKHILALQFSWKNGIKPKGSIFIGVSPEFEFALYTLCFLTSPNERVKVQFSFYDVEIVCHHYNQKHIGTTYPVLLKYQNP